MNKHIATLPPFALAVCAVLLATVGVLLPGFSGAAKADFAAIHLNLADAVFSAGLAVCWIYAAGWAHRYDANLSWQTTVARTLQYCAPVAALFAIYLALFHPHINGIRAVGVFMLWMVLLDGVCTLVLGARVPSSRRALVLGTGRIATTVWRDLRTGRLAELTFAGFVGESSAPPTLCPDIADRCVGNVRDLKMLLSEYDAEDLIVAARSTENPESVMQVAAEMGVRVWTVKQTLGVPASQGKDVAVDYIELLPDSKHSAGKTGLRKSLDQFLARALRLSPGRDSEKHAGTGAV